MRSLFCLNFGSKLSIILFILFWGQTEFSSAQNTKIDSLKKLLKTDREDTTRVKQLNDLAYAMFGMNPDSTILLSTQALELASHLDYSMGQTQSYNRIGIGWLMKGQLDSGEYYSIKALEIANRINARKIKANLQTNLGLIAWQRGEYDKAGDLLNQSLEYYRDIDDQEIQARILTNIGNLYINQSKYTEATQYYQQSLAIQETLDDKRAMATSLNNLGICYDNQGKYQQALEAYYRAVAVIEETGDNMLANVYRGIANIHEDLNEYDQALSFNLKALNSYIKSGQRLEQALTNSAIGFTYEQMDQLDTALTYYYRALNILKDYNKICGQWSLLSNLASIKIKQDQLDSVVFYANWLLTKGEDCKSSDLTAGGLLNLAEVSFLRNQLDRAKKQALEAFEIASGTGSKELIRGASDLLYQTYERQGNYSKALKYYQIKEAISDSLFNAENARTISKLEAQYEFDQEKKLLIAQKEKEELILQNELKRREILQYATLVGVVLFLIISINFYISYRRKKQDNAVISQQNSQISRAAKQLSESNKKLEQLSGFKEGLTHMIAHDMKNSLNTILGYSGSEPYDRKMQNIGQSGRVMLNLVTNMLDVQKFEEAEIALNLKPVKISRLVEEARDQVALLFQMKSLRLEIHVPPDIMIKVDHDMMVRVLVNLLTNAIKYSKPGGLIELNVEENKVESPEICLKVTDHGKGIESEKLPFIFDKFWQLDARESGNAASTGLGLTFCKMAIEAHQGSISVESKLGMGTTFHLKLPMNESAILDLQSSRELEVKGEMILEDEKEAILPYLSKLRTLEVYEVGAIKTIIEEMTENKIRSPWKNDLEVSVLHGDKERYHYLLTLVDQ